MHLFNHLAPSYETVSQEAPRYIYQKCKPYDSSRDDDTRALASKIVPNSGTEEPLVLRNLFSASTTTSSPLPLPLRKSKLNLTPERLRELVTSSYSTPALHKREVLYFYYTETQYNKYPLEEPNLTRSKPVTQFLFRQHCISDIQS